MIRFNLRVIIERLLAIALIVLLSSVASSFSTSMVRDRSIAWTPWLFRPSIGLSRELFAISDLIFICLTCYVLVVLLFGGKIVNSPYLALSILALFYVWLGVIYNVLVFTAWKPLLFDSKVFLILFMPYLFLALVRDRSIRNWFTPQRIFLYYFIAGWIDWSLTSIFRQFEAPAWYGLPIVPEILPIVVPVAGIASSKQLRSKALWFLLLVLLFISLLNRGSFFLMFNFFTAVLIIGASMLRATLAQRFVAYTVIIVIANAGSIVVLYNAERVPGIQLKSDGAAIRVMQWENLVENYKGNVFLLTGKGLGSTWFEHYVIDDPAGYSMGASISHDWEETRSSPVKFVFNSIAPSLIHKWGIGGSLVLFYLFARYYHTMNNRLFRLEAAGYQGKSVRYLRACALISLVYIVENFCFYGTLTYSLMTSCLAFYVESNVKLIKDLIQDSAKKTERIVHVNRGDPKGVA